ncbi:MAG: caa(3)-type oxidase, subunit [Verrucomicrobiales bacterium]|nr:caa(3)-type oxidase, subunit [Verrucomicrobiales bacterium]
MSDHSHSDSHAHDSHDGHDVSKDLKKYIAVFVALLVGTVITVGVSFLHIPNIALAITIALFIASVKAFLVAGWFMHLISEKKMVYSILIATVFFFVALMYLTIWSMEPNNLIHYQNK